MRLPSILQWVDAVISMVGSNWVVSWVVKAICIQPIQYFILVQGLKLSHITDQDKEIEADRITDERVTVLLYTIILIDRSQAHHPV